MKLQIIPKLKQGVLWNLIIGHWATKLINSLQDIVSDLLYSLKIKRNSVRLDSSNNSIASSHFFKFEVPVTNSIKPAWQAVEREGGKSK